MNKGKVELIRYIKEKDNQTFEYLVEQNNGKTSVEQKMKISSIDGLFDPRWVASIELEDFPAQETTTNAANKLADWLERLAGAIRTGDYMNIERPEFKDIDKTYQNPELIENNN